MNKAESITPWVPDSLKVFIQKKENIFKKSLLKLFFSVSYGKNNIIIKYLNRRLDGDSLVIHTFTGMYLPKNPPLLQVVELQFVVFYFIISWFLYCFFVLFFWLFYVLCFLFFVLFLLVYMCWCFFSVFSIF